MLWIKHILWPRIPFILLILCHAVVSDFSSFSPSLFIFILKPLPSVGFYFDLSKGTAFQKILMISYLTNEIKCFPVEISLDFSPTWEPTSNLLLLKPCFSCILLQCLPLIPFRLLFLLPPSLASLLPELHPDFIYSLKNCKQIFISFLPNAWSHWSKSWNKY